MIGGEVSDCRIVIPTGDVRSVWPQQDKQQGTEKHVEDRDEDMRCAWVWVWVWVWAKPTPTPTHHPGGWGQLEIVR